MSTPTPTDVPEPQETARDRDSIAHLIEVARKAYGDKWKCCSPKVPLEVLAGLLCLTDDLLAALRALMHPHPKSGTLGVSYDDERAIAARAAIAKAEGKG